MSFGYKPVTQDDLTLYNKHKDGVEQEIRSKHGVSDSFELKPITFFARPMCGLDLTYKVAVPNNQYVNVRFMAGGIATPEGGPPKVSFYVADTLSSSADNDD